MMIEPQVDKYGSFARASFLADYMEFVALASKRVKLASLRDLMGDTYPNLQQGFNGVDESPDPEWTSVRLADEAWTLILERSQLLGEKYPFLVGDQVLRKNEDVNSADSPYVSLLAVTLGHAFSLFAHNHVENLLEDIVADALQNLGLSVSRFGANARNGSDKFESAMQLLSTDLGMPTKHNGSVRRANAQDEGVDIVAHADWGVNRSGRWIFIGQVTCAASNEWRKKASEPVSDDWQKFLVEVSEPKPFLAVPHHADDLLFSYVSSVGTLVLDRVRIVAKLRDNTEEQKEVIRTVLGSAYQGFMV